MVIADPSVKRTSPPETENSWLNAPRRWLQKIVQSYLNLGHLITRVAPQKVTTTELMCTLATRESLGLPENGSSATPVIEAPVYENLAKRESTDAIDRSEARELLWALGEKWTKLDTHPEPAPLPPKS